MEPLFSISCTTCQAKLQVRHADAIGEILACPKCGSMVLIEAPVGWEPKPEPKPKTPEPTPSEPPGLKPKPSQPQTHSTERVSTQPNELAVANTADVADVANTATMEPADSSQNTHSTPPLQPSVPTQPPRPPDPVSAETWTLSPAGVSHTELIWRKWLLWGVSPVATVVVAFGIWSMLPQRNKAPSPKSVKPVVESKAASPTDKPTVKPIEPKPVAAQWDRRWLPRDTRLLFSLRLDQLSDQDAFERAFSFSFGESKWQEAFKRLLGSFGIRRESVKRLTWASTDLTDQGGWPDQSVVVLELTEDQDASVFRVEGEAIDLGFGDDASRRKPNAPWPHPFVVLDEHTILTGREPLLRGLADRTEPVAWASEPIDRFLSEVRPEVDLLWVVDLSSARRAGWQLPTTRFDIWPEGRDAWHVLCEMPHGLGLTFQSTDSSMSEAALLCDGPTSAEQVHAALDTLIPATKTAIQRLAGSLTSKLEAGQLGGELADQYEFFLTQSQIAISAARWEIVDQTVWMRVDWGAQFGGSIAAAEESLPAMRADWLDAALSADRSRLERLATALGGYRQHEGTFPIGAAGGVLLPPETRLSWIATLLPYFDHRDWHRQLQPGYSWNGTQNRNVTSRPLDRVVNPTLGPSRTKTGFPVTHYVGVSGVGKDAATLPVEHPRAGVFSHAHKTRLEDIHDGASNTIATLGVSGRLGPWAAGGHPTVRSLTERPYVSGPDGFGSGQPNGMLAGMADGSVRFLSKNIDPEVMEQLATIRGGTVVDLAQLPKRVPVRPNPKQPDKTKPIEPLSKATDPKIDTTKIDTTKIDTTKTKTPDSNAPDVDPSGQASVETRLAVPIAKIDFSDVAISHVVDQLGRLGNVAITFDLDTMIRSGVSPQDPITMRMADESLGTILEKVLAHRGLTYLIDGDQIIVTTSNEKRQAQRTVRYSVSDLTSDKVGPTALLARRIERLISPESWESAGGSGRFLSGPGVITATQSEAVHAGILDFCERLRVARSLPLRSKLDPKRFTLDTRLDRARRPLSQSISVNFSEPALFSRIVEELETLGGLEICINWRSLADDQIGPYELATLSIEERPLIEAVGQLVRPLGLTFRVVDAQTLEITTRKNAVGRLEVEFYPIADLLASGLDPEMLMERIQGSLAGNTWSDAGGPGIIEFDSPSKCLIVRQTQTVQGMVQMFFVKQRANQK